MKVVLHPIVGRLGGIAPVEKVVVVDHPAAEIRLQKVYEHRYQDRTEKRKKNDGKHHLGRRKKIAFPLHLLVSLSQIPRIHSTAHAHPPLHLINNARKE